MMNVQSETMALKIDIHVLLNSVEAIRLSGARVSLPDDPALVEIADPELLSTRLENALAAFRDLRGGAH